ncbi:hypothetical protein Mp_1g07160 [Marchantia polymorpha subsp. ruderalis]|uniref:Uncharacterized protein n=2 Tax=Marchantia polymorpha TaxID=3197 RepID=A0AAF6AMG4_MARPO|nr:hypothetical protein MARPO_0043s0109 [Marchantia polymorpha]BBM97634.1 hypothetical protein Mp_1g07160 [Marchantia polymorpha subsp. ruderalis]|eukprot:PTQ39876.1 hypothetical protein MARPO_0043s0109 [Marchantia polymorpha]
MSRSKTRILMSLSQDPTTRRIWFGIATAHDFESHDDMTEERLYQKIFASLISLRSTPFRLTILRSGLSSSRRERTLQPYAEIPSNEPAARSSTCSDATKFCPRNYNPLRQYKYRVNLNLIPTFFRLFRFGGAGICKLNENDSLRQSKFELTDALCTDAETVRIQADDAYYIYF